MFSMSIMLGLIWFEHKYKAINPDAAQPGRM